eukprot:GILK01001247.1.p1 GENE.GILK01001247.1~~GILK01001247.1.p1  ORF type:complete len:288 (+),score=86.93 GILK01001247.1:51-866(+)
MADRKNKLKRTIKVSNISHEASEAFVLDFFSVCGPALACRLKGEEAVVEFKDETAAKPALFFTQATMLDRQIKVEMSPMTIEEFAPEAQASASAQESDDEEEASKEHVKHEEAAAEEEEHHADTNQEEEEEQEAMNDEQEDAQAMNAEDEVQSSDEDEDTTQDAAPVAPVHQQPSPVKAPAPAPAPVPAPAAVASPAKSAPIAPAVPAPAAVVAPAPASTSATRVRVKEETLLAGRVPLPADDAFRTLSDLNVLLVVAFGFLLFLSVKSIF